MTKIIALRHWDRSDSLLGFWKVELGAWTFIVLFASRIFPGLSDSKYYSHEA